MGWKVRNPPKRRYRLPRSPADPRSPAIEFCISSVLSEDELAAAQYTSARKMPSGYLNALGALRLVLAFVLLSIACGRLQEAALECTDEAGRVLVADRVSDFLDGEMAARQQIGGS